MVQFTPLLTRYLWGHMQQTWRCCSLKVPAGAARLDCGLALSPLAQLKLRVAATESAGACPAERFSQPCALVH